MLAAAILALSVPATWAPRGESFLAKRLAVFVKGTASVRGNATGLLWLSCLAAARIVVAGVRMAICFGSLREEVSFLAAGLLASTAIVLSLVNVTPGNLGLRELALAGMATLLGSSYAVGVAAASIDRVVLLAYTVVAGLPGLWALRRRSLFRSGAEA